MPTWAANGAWPLPALRSLSTIAAWQDFELLGVPAADDPWHLMTRFLGREPLVVDQLSAPLLPLVGVLYFLTALATLRTKIRRFSFAWTLFSEAITLATFCSKDPWSVVALLALGTVQPFLELRAARQIDPHFRHPHDALHRADGRRLHLRR